MQSWTVQPIIPASFLAVIGAILIGLLFLGPSTGALSRRRWLTLSGLRLGVILLALLATLRPGCVQRIERNQSAVVIFLADISRSMDLPHREDDSTRFGALREMLEDNQSLLKRLESKQIAVQFYGFDNQLYGLDEDGGWELPAKPTGGETDIGSSVFDAALAARQDRVVGVWVASDGVQNVLDPKIELAQAANSLNDRSIPLISIPFGLPGNSGSVADVAVVSLPEQHRIAVKNRLNVNATVAARGFANQPVGVQLWVTDSAGQETLVDTDQFIPNKAFVEQKIQLSFEPSVAGEFRMRVRATAPGNELATRNNELSSFLNVYDGGLRVLYLDGGQGWEQSFLRQALSTASQDVELTTFTVYSDADSRRQWPLGAEISQLLQEPTIDVFIIGDVDARALWDPGRQIDLTQLLADAVDRGKGLMMLGGYHSFGAGRYQQTALDTVLPIRMNLDEGQDFPPAELRRDLHLQGSIKLVPRKEHFTTRLGDEEDFRAAWQELPPLVGANRFAAVKDNAEILLQSESGDPILVAGQLGGRVLAFAGDSTWRWAMGDHEREFKQFWRQVTLWLASQDGREVNNVWIDLPRRRFPPNTFITFDCRASDSVGALIPDAQFDAELVGPEGKRWPMVIDPSSQSGEIKSEILETPGIYRIELKGSKDNELLGESATEFIVLDRDKEKSVAAADPDQMERLAAQTQKHGGRVVLPEDFAELLTAMEESPPETVEIPLKWQLGQSFTDGTVFLLLFAILLGGEWILRKKWGLV